MGGLKAVAGRDPHARVALARVRQGIAALNQNRGQGIMALG
jgi:hypothetical protein